MKVIKIENNTEINKNKEDLNRTKLEIRINEIKLDPFNNWINDKFVNIDEKKLLLDSIINDIKEWRTAKFELEKENKILGSFCIIKCTGCKEWFDMECIKNMENHISDPISFDHFMKKYEKLNYTCGPKCKFIDKNISEKLKKEYLEKIKNRRIKLETIEKLKIGYKVALEQQKNLSKQYTYLITKYKELNSILVFKKRRVQYIINWIQLSVIMVSCIITFFESIKSSFENNLDRIFLVIFPIICSSYIGLILAIARFFKLDHNNEQILKLIEKYSFIVNKLRQKRNKYLLFDFKIHNLDEWNNLMNLVEKDSIDDIITKSNEEFDLIMPLKEFVKYKKKYTKVKLRELNERNNFKELVNIVNSSTNLNQSQKEIVQSIIIKKPWWKYYCCFLFCCKERDYVDYNNILVNNREVFLEYLDDKVKFKKNNKLYLNKLFDLEEKIVESETNLIACKNNNLLKIFNKCSSISDENLIEKFTSENKLSNVTTNLDILPTNENVSNNENISDNENVISNNKNEIDNENIEVIVDVINDNKNIDV